MPFINYFNALSPGYIRNYLFDPGYDAYRDRLPGARDAGFATIQLFIDLNVHML